jgi:hypothetical protein
VEWLFSLLLFKPPAILLHPSAFLLSSLSAFHRSPVEWVAALFIGEVTTEASLITKLPRIRPR